MAIRTPEERIRIAQKELRKIVEQEIKDHHIWCGPKCQTFLPSAYRQARLNGATAKSVQGDYDSCHVFR